MDISETAEHFLVRLDLPGVHRGEVEVTVDDETLVICGQRRPTRRAGMEVSRRERRYGTFRRTVELPSGTDRGTVSASLRDGVLEVCIGKAPGQVPKRVEIKAATEEASSPSDTPSSDQGK